MAIWNVDLTTEDGALSAAQLGGFACLIAAGLGVIGLIVIGVTSNGTSLPMLLVAGLAGAAVEVVLFGVAALRLRAGKGIVWGSVAAVLLAVELVMKIMTLAVIGILIDAILLIGVVNGIRGVRALGRIDLKPADAAEIFN